MARISLRHVEKRYDEVSALVDCNLEIGDHEFMVLVGPSGSGKTTLLRIIAGLEHATGGEIYFDDQRVNDIDVGERDVAMVFQHYGLYPHMSVFDNMAFGLRRRKLAGEQIDRRVRATAKMLSIDALLERRPRQLSGGQRQRVAIARALAVRPRVLLADEPVSMLDVSIRLGILNLLDDLRERERLAVLYITHDIASARYLADTIVVMYAGQVVESGPAQAVTDQPAHPYTRLLLSAAPDPDRAGPVALRGRGAPPSLVTPPSGCRFHPRCPHAMAVCVDAVPPGIDVAAGHVSACWLQARDLSAAQAAPIAQHSPTPEPGRGDAVNPESP